MVFRTTPTAVVVVETGQAAGENRGTSAVLVVAVGAAAGTGNAAVAEKTQVVARSPASTATNHTVMVVVVGTRLLAD